MLELVVPVELLALVALVTLVSLVALLALLALVSLFSSKLDWWKVTASCFALLQGFH